MSNKVRIILHTSARECFTSHMRLRGLQFLFSTRFSTFEVSSALVLHWFIRFCLRFRQDKA
jgi:hypothetical protein